MCRSSVERCATRPKPSYPPPTRPPSTNPAAVGLDDLGSVTPNYPDVVPGLHAIRPPNPCFLSVLSFPFNPSLLDTVGGAGGGGAILSHYYVIVIREYDVRVLYNPVIAPTSPPSHPQF